MQSLIIFLPLIGSIVSGFGGRFLGYNGAILITTICLLFSTIFSYTTLIQLLTDGNFTYIHILKWFDSELLEANWSFYFDSVTVIMLIVVTTISLLVHIYSSEYMAGDPHIPRFMAYLSFFTFCMLMLVTADNFIQLFFGWEGVGVSSYLLISFWFTRIAATKAAIKAIIVNRIGDFGLSLGILTIFLIFKTVDFSSLFAIIYYFQINEIDSIIMLNKPFINFIFFNQNFNLFNVICILLFIGAVGKSAQLGLHTWLPDAMEGPTPVSALIHAATMVTAGVFLLIRCSILFEYAPDVLLIITFLGACTAFFAATAGLLQNDLKKVIAYSTCSQLGYMVFACGLSNYSVSLFHLMNHAFFKALLFLSAGSVIHAMADEQDMRKMGGLVNILPFTYSMMLIGSLSLMGFPFLTGFYSKDVILELTFAKYTVTATFAYWLGTLAAFFTAFYSFRLLYLTFLANTNAFKKIMEQAHDAPIRMSGPLGVLVFGSIFVGFLTKDLMIGLGSDFFGHAITILPKNLNIIDSEFLSFNIKLLPVFFSLTGAVLAILLNHTYDLILINFKLNFYGAKVYGFLNKKWFFDNIYNEFIVKSSLYFGYHISFKMIDRGIIEILGPYGLKKSITDLANVISGIQTGFIYNYALLMLMGSIFFILSVALGFLLNILTTQFMHLLFIYILILYSLTKIKTLLSQNKNNIYLN